MKKSRISPDAVKQIIDRYPDTPTSVLSDEFNYPIHYIYKLAERYNVKKSSAFMQSEYSGRIRPGQQSEASKQHRFKPGHVPASKGKKLADYCSPEGIQRSIKSRFKKGNKPVSTLYDGAITIRQVKSKGVARWYKFIRIREKEWEFYHRHIWKKANGAIPEGYNIVFKDGDTLNCTLDNLECISNAELAQRNTIHNLPEPIKELIYLRTSLKKQIDKTLRK